MSAYLAAIFTPGVLVLALCWIADRKRMPHPSNGPGQEMRRKILGKLEEKLR